MPELPEVETTRRGIEPHLIHKSIAQIIVRPPKLRWPVPKEIPEHFAGHTINSIDRRGKYLLFNTDVGTLIMHLGMSGSMRVLKRQVEPKKHDHVDIVCDDGTYLRFTDPRKFGCLLWTDEDPLQHKLLKNLGVEPLSDDFNADYLFQKTRRRKVTIKQLLMNSKVLVGVGNIYTNEALFAAGIRPTRIAAKLTKVECEKLVIAVKEILTRAINKGGTTLKDFSGSDGKPGYFKQRLKVYGRKDKKCSKCGQMIKAKMISGRNSFYCAECQK